MQRREVLDAVPREARRLGILVLDGYACPWLLELLALFDRAATPACPHIGRRNPRVLLHGYLSGALPVWCSECGNAEDVDLLGRRLLRPGDCDVCARCDASPDETTVAQCVATSPRGVLVNLRLCASCVADYAQAGGEAAL